MNRRTGLELAECRKLKRAFAVLCFALVSTAAVPCRAELPSFEDFFTGVSECQLDMARFGPLVNAYGEGAVIALPSAGAMRGFLIDSFYVSPRRGHIPAQYGLRSSMRRSMPYAAHSRIRPRMTINGHVRWLTRLSEQIRARGATRKTLLVCIGESKSDGLRPDLPRCPCTERPTQGWRAGPVAAIPAVAHLLQSAPA